MQWRADGLNAQMSVSIISPVYGCAGCLRELVETIEESLQDRIDYEIVLVCDRSLDNSWLIINDLALTNPRVKGVLFARNYGQQVAVSAGIDLASKEFLVVMDCDLQDDPADLPKLLEVLRQGSEVVIARSKFRGSRGLARRVGRGLYLRLFGYLIPEIQHANVSFFGMSRKAVEAFKLHSERSRHVSSIVRNLGFDPSFVDVQHKEATSKSTYSFRKRANLAYEGLLLNSERLMRHLVIISFSLGVLSLTGLGCLLMWRILNKDLLPGWVSQMTILTLVLSTQLVGFATLGGLLQKVLHEVRMRPLYIIDQRIGFPSQ